MIRAAIRPAIVLVVLFTLITGVVYPLGVWYVGHWIFAYEAEGSLLEDAKGVHGSELLGQAFSRPEYLWGRLSATAPVPYNGGASSGSNLGPLNPALHDASRARIDALRAADSSLAGKAIPIDLATASASGLDPDVSLAAALIQVPRVATARGVSEESVRAVVLAHADHGGPMGLGESRLNVLVTNMDLDRQLGRHP